MLSVSIRCGKLQPPVISFNDVAFSYSGKKQDYLFSGLHFGIDSDSRIALVGPNGAGKSTLLKVRIFPGGQKCRMTAVGESFSLGGESVE